MSAKHGGWRYILKGDESWFYFTVSQDQIRLPEEAVIPTRPRETVSTPKRIFTSF
jgi:hypothetical protein